MTTKEQVDRYFHGVEKYNCAQALLKIMEAKFPAKAELIPIFKAFGGGRAPEGLCGALYGALELTPESEHLSLRNKFCEVAGSEKCSGIKNLNKLSCPCCVEVAVDLVKE
jgi:Putative redox-active protein (C_GCAxxG_C_C)